MTGYLLIIFNDDISKELCEELTISISQIVDSERLKFATHNGSIIYHYASDVDYKEMEEYLNISLQGFISSFILAEVNDKLSLFMSKEITDHLFNLNEDGEHTTIKINARDMPSNFLDDEEDDDEEYDDYVALLLNEVKKKVSKPTLDQLLDKIDAKGFGELTQFEKDILESYSKN
jgi:hypothetical protein